jgi:Protein of unknown function (DUF3435)
MNYDLQTFLTRGDKEDIMIFFKWLHDNSRITKLSTSQEYKRVNFMLYRRSVGHSLHAKIAQDIDDVRVVSFAFVTEAHRLTREQYINVDLKRLYILDTSMAEKPVMNVDDIYLILYHHWVMDTATFPDGRQRLQIDFLELLIAGTATRPAALVYVRRNEKRIKGHCIGEDDSEEEEKEEYGCNRNDSRDHGDSDWENEDDKTLCYKDVTLLLLPNPGGIRDLLAMEVDIAHTKGHLKKRKRYVSTPPSTSVAVS